MTDQQPGSDLKIASTATAGGAAAGNELSGFSSCNDAPLVWQRIYHDQWEEVNEKYFDPPALKDFGQYEHKFDARLCTPADLNLGLKRMADSLHNPWTKYTSAAEQQAKDDQNKLGLAASGFELASAGLGRFKIEFIHYGSPAKQSVLREGDIVKSIDGKDLSSLSLDQAKALELGKIGNTMQVEAEHGGVPEIVSLKLAATPDEKLDSKMLANGIAYARLPDFKSEAGIDQFLQSLDQLNKSTPGGLKGLVLDLRNDPGGDLPNAVTLASLFLPNDYMKVATIYDRLRDPDNPQAMREKPLIVTPAHGMTLNGKFVDEDLIQTLRKLHLTVIINGSSASAAEVFTGAVKDNGRATIVGTHSFGKGVGYKTEHTQTGGKLNITEMKYLTPSGYDLNGRGISPDIVVESKPGEAEDEQLKAAIKTLDKQT